MKMLFRFVLLSVSFLCAAPSSWGMNASYVREELSKPDAAQQATQAARRRVFLSEAFGAQAWKEYFGVEVDVEPELPSNIEEILNASAPFTLEDETSPRRARENHLLTLIPGSVDDVPFTLDKARCLAFRKPKRTLQCIFRQYE